MGKYDSLNLFTDEEDINPEIFVSIANELAESNRLKILDLRMKIFENKAIFYPSDILNNLEDKA